MLRDIWAKTTLGEIPPSRHIYNYISAKFQFNAFSLEVVLAHIKRTIPSSQTFA